MIFSVLVIMPIPMYHDGMKFGISSRFNFVCNSQDSCAYHLKLHAMKLFSCASSHCILHSMGNETVSNNKQIIM